MSDGKALTDWQPSDLQRHVLSVFQANEYSGSIVANCQAAAISRETYYTWHENPAFGTWWQDQAEHFFRLQLHQVQQVMFRAAKGEKLDGGYDRKLFLERFDKSYCPASRGSHEISGPGGGAIPIQVVMFGTPLAGGADSPDETDPGDAAAGA